MRQEDKELLLKDLSARLPYGIKCQVETISGERNILLDYMNLSYIFKLPTDMWKDCKPYLRPMSSMTEDELREYEELCFIYDTSDGTVLFGKNGLDWLNAHHFDYRGLIPKGLAIAITKENNPYET